MKALRLTNFLSGIFGQLLISAYFSCLRYAVMDGIVFLRQRAVGHYEDQYVEAIVSWPSSGGKRKRKWLRFLKGTVERNHESISRAERRFVHKWINSILTRKSFNGHPQKPPPPPIAATPKSNSPSCFEVEMKCLKSKFSDVVVQITFSLSLFSPPPTSPTFCSSSM